MYISEVGAGTELKLEVAVGTKTLDFETKAATVEDKRQYKMIVESAEGRPFVVTEPITKDGKMVGFSSSGVSYKVLYVNPESKKVNEWREVTVKQIAFSTGDKFHIFICDKQMKEINRRESFRLWLGCKAVAQIGLNKVAFDVVIKDISATGVSFYMLKNISDGSSGVGGPRISSSVILSFHDEESGKNFKLNATIVRTEEIDELKTLYGCKFAQESPVLAKFVNNKQMQRSNVNQNKEPEKKPGKK